MKVGKVAGRHNVYGYIVIRVNKVLYPAHRLAWLIQTGDWPPDQIDHVNGIRDDNRFEIFRLATGSQNMINEKASLPNTTGYRGVIYWRGKWRAQIHINGRNTALGTFDTPDRKPMQRTSPLHVSITASSSAHFLTIGRDCPRLWSPHASHGMRASILGDLTFSPDALRSRWPRLSG